MMINQQQQRGDNIFINAQYPTCGISSPGCPNCERPCSIDYHLQMLAAYSDVAKALYSVWDNDRRNIGAMLSLISATPFQTFSDHGAGHSEMLLTIMERILGARLCLLGATDTWALLECAYRHDLGMYIERKDIQRIFNGESDFKDKLDTYMEDGHEDLRKAAHCVKDHFDVLREYYNESVGSDKIKPELSYQLNLILARYFRSGHAKRSKRILIDEKSGATNQTVPMRIWRIIADVCAGHGEDIDDILDNRPYKEMGLDNDEMHPRLLQMLVRLSDSLDLDDNRFNPYQLAQWGVDLIPTESLEHYEKHKSLQHLHVDTRNVSIKAQIRYEANEPKAMCDEDYYKKIKQVDGELKNDGKNHTANGIIRELKKSHQDLLHEIHRMEDVNQYHYNASQIKCNASRFVKKYMEEIEDELQFLAANWYDIVPEKFHGSAPKFDKDNSGILWKKKKIDDEIVDLKYSISHRRASEIMRGTSLYGDVEYAATPILSKYYHRLIFLREFVQNAMDATKMQLFRDIKGNRYGMNPRLAAEDPINWDIFEILDIIKSLNRFAVTIRVRYRMSDEALVFEIIDNGCGIDKDTMKLMKDVGAIKSSKITDEIKSMPDWLRPNGSFGIGMQSVYAVTDKFNGFSQAQSDLIRHEMLFEYGPDGGSLFAEELDKRDSRYSEYGYGTMFNIVIPREKVMEDFVNVTPFTFDVDKVFEEIQSRVDRFISHDLFPVRLKFYIDEVEIEGNDEEEPKIGKTYGGAFDWINQAYKDLQNCHCDRSGFTWWGLYNEKYTVISYNKARNMLVEICFVKGILEKSETAYVYRGLFVPGGINDSEFAYPGCVLTVYHWEGNAEDMLIISRNKLKTAVQPVVYSEIAESVDIALNVFAGYSNANDNLGEGVSGFAQALFHYKLRGAVQCEKSRQKLNECDKWLKEYSDVYKVSQKVFELSEEEMYYLYSPTSEVYQKSLSDLWFLQLEIDSRFKPSLSITYNMSITYKIEPGTLILHDECLKQLFEENRQLNVSRIYKCEINSEISYLYQLSDIAADGIETDDETLKFYLEEAIGDETPSHRSLNGIISDRPVVPGFMAFRGLNVRKLPVKNDCDRIDHISTHLGNYFIWPFSKDDIKQLDEWLGKQDEGTIGKDINYLKKCKVIADALNIDTPAYRKLLLYVSENLSFGARVLSENTNTSDEAMVLRELSNRYESVIEKVLCPVLYKKWGHEW